MKYIVILKSIEDKLTIKVAITLHFLKAVHFLNDFMKNNLVSEWVTESCIESHYEYIIVLVKIHISKRSLQFQ